MKAIDPRIDVSLVPDGSKPRVINSRDQSFVDVPAITTPNGQVITRWTLTDEERAAIAAGADVFVTLLSAGMINPLFVTAGPVDWNT